MTENLNNKVVNATKWSAVSEVLAKLVAPISSMVLARVLTPEAFGVVATLNMVIAFAEIFTDAGFQRYLIQHKFENETDKDKTTNVAFWSNLMMSFGIWGLIAIFREPLATLVGNPGLGNVLALACVSIPLAAFSSIQMALFRRSLDFKTLFWRRLAMVLVPLCVTVPLAFWLRSYWALVIGTIITNLVNALLLTIKSNWRPRLYYSFVRMKAMLSFCLWVIILSLLTWITNYCDILFISRSLNEYYLGLYKTSITTVGQFTSVITAAIVPVILPAISKLQSDIPKMRDFLLRIQKYTAIVLLPLGVGIYLYKDVITIVMLGNQWSEAAPFIGLWGLVEVLVFVFGNIFGGISTALGKPKLSVYSQLLMSIVLIPAIIISGQYGFRALYITRSLVRLYGVVVGFFFIYYLVQISPWKMIVNIVPEFIACFAMIVIAKTLSMISNTLLLSFVWIGICALVYFFILYLYPTERAILINIKDKTVQLISKKR